MPNFNIPSLVKAITTKFIRIYIFEIFKKLHMYHKYIMLYVIRNRVTVYMSNFNIPSLVQAITTKFINIYIYISNWKRPTEKGRERENVNRKSDYTNRKRHNTIRKRMETFTWTKNRKASVLRERKPLHCSRIKKTIMSRKKAFEGGGYNWGRESYRIYVQCIYFVIYLWYVDWTNPEGDILIYKKIVPNYGCFGWVLLFETTEVQCVLAFYYFDLLNFINGIVPELHFGICKHCTYIL